MKHLKYIIALLIILTFTGQAYSAQFIPKYFLQLRDVPSSFSGSGGYCTKVNVGATALEFVSCETGSHATFLTAESDPIIKAINGFVQCNGTTCSAATTMNITSIDMSTQTSSIPWIVNTSVPGTYTTNGMAWYDSDGYYLAIRDQTNTRNLLFYPKVLTDTYYHPLTSTDNSGDCTSDYMCLGGHGHSQYVLIATPFFTGATDFLQVATPATPDANHTKLYFKSDDKLYKKTSAGAETEIGSGTASVITVTNHTTSGTITCENGNVHTNNGASGTITLKLASMTEAQHCLIKRISAYRINIEPNVETDEIKDVTSGAGKGAYTESDWGQIDLLSYANTKMVPTNAKGTWTEYSPDYTPPTVSSITIGTNGTSWTFAYSEAVTCTSTPNCCDDFTAAMTTAGAITLSYASGSGSSSVVCTGSPTVGIGDTIANGGADYTTVSNGIEDATGNDLASFTDKAVTNNSTVENYLYQENFEGSNNCISGSYPYCDSSVVGTEVINSGSLTYNYATSPAPLVGSYSLGATATIEAEYHHTFTANDTVGIYFQMNFNTIPAGEGVWFKLKDGSSNNVAYCYFSDGVSAIKCSQGTVSAGGSTLTPGTTYHVWIDYTKGTGSNGILSVYTSTNATKPGSANVAITTGTATAQAAKAVWAAAYTTTFIYDKLRVKSSAIGSNPD